MERNIFFTADLHFSHYRMLHFEPERCRLAGITPEDLENKDLAIAKHDDWLIKRWNEQVNKNDIVYILGDFCLGTVQQTIDIFHKLHGKKYMIIGNHDKKTLGTFEKSLGCYKDIHELIYKHSSHKYIDEKFPLVIELCHYPMFAWPRRCHGAVHLHGHVHGNMDEYNFNSKDLRLDVGLGSKIANYNLVPLNKVYDYFIDLQKSTNSHDLKEHISKVMETQGFRA